MLWYLIYVDRRSLGAIGEAAAGSLLESRGYRIIGRNFRCPLGEIDLVAEVGATVVFVEVKARTSADYGAPSEAITWRKRLKLLRLATYYLKGRNWLGRPARFDAVSVKMAPDGSVLAIELIEGVLEAGG